MITLHRNKHDPAADRIEENLKNLVLAYRTVIDSELDSAYITDGNQKIEQGKEMDDWLFRLESELKWQRSLSGDGCYIDLENGKIC